MNMVSLTTRRGTITCIPQTNGTWDVAITALEGRLEELGSNTQQEMVYLQANMGQNSYNMQGAKTQIANSNQTLTSLARGQ